MLSIEVALVAAALIAGATGTWSPCGFSAVETLGPGGHSGGRSLSVVASLTFLAGALAGGLLTFGVLGLLGAALGSGSGVAVSVAAAVALAAAAGELANVRVFPQIRRQVPETWRRWMPLPMVGAGYGLLLGLGFTTFVLTFGVWALAAVAIAAGNFGTGLAIGAGFGLGRALPVVVLAPFADTPFGCTALDAMAERPATYRAFRLANAAALSVAAMMMITTGALAKRGDIGGAYDPSAVGGALVYERADGSSVIESGGQRKRLDGSDPAIGRLWIALIRDGQIVLRRRQDRIGVAAFGAEGVDAVAVDAGYLLWRTRKDGRDRIYARTITKVPDGGGTAPPGEGDAVRLGDAKRVASSSRRAQLGRPSVDGNRAVWAQSTPDRNSIVLANLGTNSRRRIRSTTGGALQNVSIHANRIAYVAIKRRKQLLVLARIDRPGPGRTLLRRRSGLIWSTEITAKRVFATIRTASGLRIRSIKL